MFDPEVPCRIMETRRCEQLAAGELIERYTQCAEGECFRFETPYRDPRWENMFASIQPAPSPWGEKGILEVRIDVLYDFTKWHTTIYIPQEEMADPHNYSFILGKMVEQMDRYLLGITCP